MSSTVTHFSKKSTIFREKVLDENIIFEEYNSIKKIFSNGLIKIKKNSFSNFKGLYRENRHNGTMSEEKREEKNKKYLKNVKTNIIDLALNYSNWEYFITLTFDDKEVGEYSHDKAISLLTKWINNQKHQNRQMTYLLVPEFHESGRLHFHGLISNVPKWKFTAARYPKDYKIKNFRGKLIKKNGLQIYNLDNYNLGFTTISKVQDQQKVSNYISKYATKELITLKSKKRYWYSRNLEKPTLEYEYIENNLYEHLKDEQLDYFDYFEKENCLIEVAQYARQHNFNYRKLHFIIS